MHEIKSYVLDRWVSGDGPGTELHDPSHGTVIAQASTAGIDFKAALRHAREVGGSALRALTFAQRGELLDQIAKVIHGGREELIALSALNAGSPRGDAKFDIDGATATLAAYARYGRELGDRTELVDGPMEALGRSPRFSGQHIKVPLRGVAVHINAFNFPCWGPAEKLACAFLAGVPVISKPATSTALITYRMAELIVESGILPKGTFSFIGGSISDLMDHLTSQDCVAFTGSASTGRKVRGHPRVVEHNVRVNIEADSLNCMVVGPDVERGSETWRLFVRELAREMTQKTGQKCTATRRVILKAGADEGLAEDLREELAQVKAGIPGEDGVRMGPLATPSQLEDVRAGLAELSGIADVIVGSLEEGANGPGAFVSPLVFRMKPGADASLVHEREVFGPIITVIPYDGDPLEAARLASLADGSLVGTIYSDDLEFTGVAMREMAPWHGRLLLGSKRIVEHSTGPGLVLPNLHHGGPGRAGGGSELGGLRGLDFYLLTVAIQGARPVLERLLDVKSD